MRRVLILTCLLGISAPAAASDKISIGAARVSVDFLAKEGLTRVEARAYTGTLIDWMHNAGTASDGSMQQALIALIGMLREGVVTPEGMSALCEVAPQCVMNLAIGGGMETEEARTLLQERRWVAKNALGKMFAIARNRYENDGEGQLLVSNAESLPPLR